MFIILEKLRNRKMKNATPEAPENKYTLFVYCMCFISSLFISQNIFAYQSQLHINTGMFKGSYKSDESRSFSSVQSFHAEYEIFKDSRNAHIFHTTMVTGSSGKMDFYSANYGRRYYFNSTATITENFDPENSIKSMPKWRYYGGWDVGVSQVLLKDTGAISVVGTMVDIGGHIGATYQFNRDWGFDMQAAAIYDYGFAAVSISGMSQKVLLGITYFFK